MNAIDSNCVSVKVVVRTMVLRMIDMVVIIDTKKEYSIDTFTF
jgi:hypothetical protein